MDEDLYKACHNLQKQVDVITLSFTNYSPGGADIISSVLTFGALMGQDEKGLAFAQFYDGFNDLIEEKTKSMDKHTMVVCYNPKSATTANIDTTGADGSMYGDAWAISHLGFEDIATPQGDGNYDMNIEAIITMDPDYIFFTLNNSTLKAEDPQAAFQAQCDYFQKTSAYKNGNIYGTAWTTTGTHMGFTLLCLLASYVFPEDFSTEEGLSYLEDAYDRFTLYSGDLSDYVYVKVFKMEAE